MKWSLKSIHGASSPHFNAALFHIDMLRDVRRKKLLSFCYVVAEGNYFLSLFHSSVEADKAILV